MDLAKFFQVPFYSCCLLRPKVLTLGTGASELGTSGCRKRCCDLCLTFFGFVHHVRMGWYPPPLVNLLISECDEMSIFSDIRPQRKKEGARIAPENFAAELKLCDSQQRISITLRRKQLLTASALVWTAALKQLLSFPKPGNIELGILQRYASREASTKMCSSTAW